MVDNNEQPAGEVTRLLQRWSDGDTTALDALWPLVYDDIRRMAGRQIAGERGGHTLQATALVNEAFIRLAGERAFHWQRREQFLSAGRAAHALLCWWTMRDSAMPSGAAMAPDV